MAFLSQYNSDDDVVLGSKETFIEACHDNQLRKTLERDKVEVNDKPSSASHKEARLNGRVDKSTGARYPRVEKSQKRVICKCYSWSVQQKWPLGRLWWLKTGGVLWKGWLKWRLRYFGQWKENIITRSKWYPEKVGVPLTWHHAQTRNPTNICHFKPSVSPQEFDDSECNKLFELKLYAETDGKGNAKYDKPLSRVVTDVQPGQR